MSQSITRIYLLGMMGSGKSTVGLALANALMWQFIDLDQQIVADTQMTIDEIFAEKGEKFFRAEETKQLTAAKERENCVIATGGGVITTAGNCQVMQSDKSGLKVYLKAQPEILKARLTHSDRTKRPLLDRDDWLAHFMSMYNTRAPLYLSCADIVQPTDQDDVALITKELLSALESYLIHDHHNHPPR